MSSIHLPYQRVPRWNIDQATIALDCARLGLPVPKFAAPAWENGGNKLHNYIENQVNGAANGTTWEKGGLKFDAADYVTFDDSDIWTWTPVDEDRTLSFWFYPTVLPTDNGNPFQFLITTGSSGNRYQWVFMQQSGVTYLYVSVMDNLWNALGFFYAPWSMSLTTWYHITFVASSATNCAIYVNRVKQSVTENSWDDNTAINPTTTDIKDSVGNTTGSGIVRNYLFWHDKISQAQNNVLYNNPYGMFEPIRRPAWYVPLLSTTAAPTTLPSTTVAPTTLAPTTTAPTTPVYTTIAPTTVLVATTPVSTTLAPTTLPPTTVAPTTLAPTTLAPTTAAPADIRSAQVLAQVEWQEPGLIKSAQVLAQVEWVEDVSTTAAPTTTPSTTLAPTTVAPTTLAPTTLAPTTLAPTTPTYTTVGPTTIHVATTPIPTTTEPTPAPPTTIWQTTIGPTTKAPTTAEPTTPAPTTSPATTVSPTTEPFTTSAPTTIAPTTTAPTTLQPTTLVPTTEFQTTIGPTTKTPTTLEPTTPIPTTAAPTTGPATTPVSTTTEPTTLAPTTQVPTTLVPTTLAVTTLIPTTLPPTTNIPEEVCIRSCNSPMIDEILCGSIITKEITCNGNLC